MRKLIFPATAIATLCLATYAPCQETRATLTGLVTDQTKAVVPNAPIDVVNIDTGATVHAKSNAQGSYTVPFLAAPGNYKISVTMTGFKAYLHTGLELQVDQTVKENIVLEIGSVNESVIVTTATPMIDTSNADTGQSITAEEVRDLPNNGNSPFSLERDEYGVIPTGKQATAQLTPTSNTTASQVSIGGGQSASGEVLLNGIPDMESSSRQVSFIPQLDSVNTIHVDQFSANAANGDTVGGTINITTKSGTNNFHGTLSEYYNGGRPFSARPYFSTPSTYVASTHYNQPGATIGGPVWIPHFFNGHNKLFFFYAWEGFYTKAGSPTIASVPTADERNGDFHNLLAADGTKGQLFDPYSGSFQTIGTQQAWIRSAIPNNCLTATTAYCSSNAHNTNPSIALSPIAQKYLALIPLPNYSGASTTADGENNYISTAINSTNYNSHMVRLDWNISDTDKIFGELHLSNYTNATGSYYGIPAISGAVATFKQPGGQIDNVKTFSPSLSLETRLGFQRYNQVNSPASLGTDPTTFGFPSYISSNSGSLATPYVTFSDGSTIDPFSQQTNGYGIIDYLTGYVVVNKTMGHHSLKAGIDARVWKKSGFSPTAASGNYSFTASATGLLAQSPNYSPDEVKQPFGSSLALLDLGLPSSGSYQITQKFQYDNWYEAYFLQDDWKATRELTFSLGLRLDHETAVVESNNRMLQNFYTDRPNSSSSAASAAYAGQRAGDATAKGVNAAYLPASINANGATVYETAGNRAPFHNAPLYVSPRIGIAYAPAAFDNKLVIRGGFSIVNQPFGTYTSQSTTGYSQVTALQGTSTSVNSGYTPITTWENPFPATAGTANYNPIAQPVGSAYGTDAALGSSPFFFQDRVKVPYTEKFGLDIQKEFAHGWMAEIGGLHTLSLHNSTYFNVNNYPYTQFLDHTPNGNSTSATAVNAAMTAQVTNPFKGLFPTYTSTSGALVPNTTSLNTGATVPVSTLLLANPEFPSVSGFYVPSSTVHFNALTARVEKRMSKGFEINANFEWSRQIGATAQINPGQFWIGETTSDFPIHVAVISIYELPFGKGRLFMTHANKAVDYALGGWKVSGEFQYLSGTPISWGNVNYKGTYNDFNFHPHQSAGAAFNTSVFDTVGADQPGAWNYRTFPLYALRTDPTNNFNFSALKDFVLRERFIMSFRVDAFNALNHAQLAGPNVTPTSTSFGVISGTNNTARTLAGGLHLRF